MQCRQCGTEIADKALICYRCGAATTDPVRKPAAVKTSGSITTFVVLILLVLAALFLGEAARVRDALGGAIVWVRAALGLIAVVIVIRMLRRR